jgi:uncharacterized protein YaiE (UPF0345 family)
MKVRRILGTLLALLVCAPGAWAQYKGSNTNNNAEIGVFFNYTNLHNAANANFYGVGGRIGFNTNKYVLIEAEGAYDFQRNVDAQVNLGSGSFTSERSGLRMVHFMAGPKFQVGGSSPVHLFVTVKGGLINFSTDTSFSGQVTNIPTGNTDGVLYPAGGVELFAGKLGLRVEAGDEIYFDNGANHNLRVTAGPTLRF